MSNNPSKPVLKRFYRKLVITTVSNDKGCSGVRHVDKPGIDQNEVIPIAIGSDTTTADSIDKAWQIKVFLN